jgi:hypothetical protein
LFGDVAGIRSRVPQFTQQDLGDHWPWVLPEQQEQHLPRDITQGQWLVISEHAVTTRCVDFCPELPEVQPVHVLSSNSHEVIAQTGGQRLRVNLRSWFVHRTRISSRAELDVAM